MKKHLDKCVEEAEYVENRKEASFDLVEKKNLAVQDYNRKINSYLKEIARQVIVSYISY
jgi:hypothetical protein